MYHIQRDSDGMWLLNYVQGINSSGKPSCVWSDKDALLFLHYWTAEAIAALIGGCTVVHVREGK